MFVITSRKNGPCAANPLFWNGNIVVGRMAAGTAARYNTAEEAFRALNNDVTEDQRRFYDLAVVECLFIHQLHDLAWSPPRRS